MMRNVYAAVFFIALLAAALLFHWLKPHCKEVTWYAFGNAVTLEHCE